MKKVIKAFKNIVSTRDLKTNKLTLAEYYDLSMTLQSIIDAGSGTTILKNVAEWCKRNNLKVKEESICFNISA